MNTRIVASAVEVDRTSRSEEVGGGFLSVQHGVGNFRHDFITVLYTDACRAAGGDDDAFAGPLVG